MKCYLCDTELNEQNLSDEHIIPNALGGKWTEKILCKECNNKVGSDYDFVLAQQLEWFSCKINHSRSYGKIKPVKVIIDGMYAQALPGGDYEGLKCNKISDNHYQIQAVGKKSVLKARRKLEEIMRKSAKKYNWDEAQFKERLDAGYTNIEKSFRKQNNPIIQFSSQFGGKEALLSTIRIAVNFAIAKGIPTKYLEQSIKTLKENQEDYTLFSNLFYPNDIFPKGSIYHTLILVGDNQSGRLYCLISLYGVFRVFVLMSSNYSEKNILYTYCYDIWNEKEVRYKPNRVLNSQEINYALSSNENDWEQNMKKMKEAVEEFLRFFVLDDFQENFEKLLCYTVDQIARCFPFLEKDVFIKQLEVSLINGKRIILKNKILKDKNIENMLREENREIFYKYYMGRKVIFEISNVLTRIVIDKISSHEEENLKNCDYLLKYLSEYTECIYKNSPIYSEMKHFISDKNTIISLLNIAIIPIFNKYASLLKK